MCNGPVGLGANRTLTSFSMIESLKVFDYKTNKLLSQEARDLILIL